MNKIQIRTDAGDESLALRDIYTRILEAAHRIVITPLLYDRGTSHVRRQLQDVMNVIYAGYDRYTSEVDSKPLPFPEDWKRRAEELISELMPVVTAKHIGDTGIQRREENVFGFATEHNIRLPQNSLIRFATLLDPRWFPYGTVSFQPMRERDIRQLMTGALDYQMPKRHELILRRSLKRLAFDRHHIYDKPFILRPGAKIVLISVNPDSGSAIRDWVIDYNVVTVQKMH